MPVSVLIGQASGYAAAGKYGLPSDVSLSKYPAATKKPHPVWMRLFAWKLFPLHGRDEEEEAVGHGGEG